MKVWLLYVLYGRMYVRAASVFLGRVQEWQIHRVPAPACYYSQIGGKKKTIDLSWTNHKISLGHCFLGGGLFSWLLS